MHPNVKRIDWPANSGDISPLSTVWDNMHSYVDQKFPLTNDEIKYLIYLYWDEVLDDGDYFQDRFNEIKKCLQTVIDKEGAHLYE